MAFSAIIAESVSTKLPDRESRFLAFDRNLVRAAREELESYFDLFAEPATGEE